MNQSILMGQSTFSHPNWALAWGVENHSQGGGKPNLGLGAPTAEL